MFDTIIILEIGNKKTKRIKMYAFLSWKPAHFILQTLRMVEKEESYLPPGSGDEFSYTFERREYKRDDDPQEITGDYAIITIIQLDF
jgi:hypothetical protein